MTTQDENSQDLTEEDFLHAFLDYKARLGEVVHDDDISVHRFDGDTLILHFLGERFKVSSWYLEGATWLDTGAGRFYIR